MEWFKTTLQTYPELAVLLSLAVGYWVGGKSFKGFSLGAVTSTLLAGILIGQLGITISGPLKSFFFLLFLFAVGYGIGPQFVRGIAKDGLPQAGFAAIVCLISLLSAVLAAKIAGYNMGEAAGLFAGSQTISASMGLATDAINRAGLPPDQTASLLASMPVAYAVTYIFGTIGSAFLLAQILPTVMRINLEEACRDYEEKNKTDDSAPTEGTAWHEYELRAYKLSKCADNMTVGQMESKFPDRHVFIEGVRRDGKELETTTQTLLQAGDVVAIGGDHGAVVDLGDDQTCFDEVDDRELVSQPVSGVDVYVSRKEVTDKTLAQLAATAGAHGVFLRRIKRGLTGVDIPILGTTTLHHGDIVTLSGLDKNVKRAAKELGVVDQRSTVTDVAAMCGAIVIGGLFGALVVNVGGVPLTFSTAGGALIGGLVFGWLRSIHPTFGYIPEPTVWFMNSVGLNVFIAVVGITAGPNFVAGLKESGVSLFLWGVAVTSVPLICGAYIGRYLFKFHPAILFGCCAGARTTTAALGMINEKAKSNIPSLGYTVTYAVGNALLTMWGLVIILILSKI
ncbi:aspartate-alanine antiporter [Deltaproteobacteria bacterium Smac51]|nr:aspartate-alanine antiporter [Deltaproteobacteria bacterium Smac51]